MALAPGTALLNHSCVPNCQIEARIVPGGGDGDDETCGGLRVTLVALRDVAEGEEITTAYVPSNQRYFRRRRELRRRYGFACDCPRCALEASKTSNAPPPNLKVIDWLRLADQAQEEARYDDAHFAATAALELDPRDGDAAHKIGTALLGRGEWAAAHAAWRRGFAIAPEHAALSRQAAKDAAYLPGVSTDSPPPPPPRFVTAHAAGVWQTAPDAPLLSERECLEWIAAAEAHAAKTRGGWTTSRHYAVPTTDLPVHAVEALVPRWNDLMREKLSPLLAAACADVVARASSVRVHDVFVVMYDASAQHHLPIHVDQSAVSLTLALNGGDAFDGGGTTFADLGVTCSPETGHAAVFRGDLRHGGAPVTRGVRYVVAAFLFVE